MPKNILVRQSSGLAAAVAKASVSAKRAITLAVCTAATAQEIPDDSLVQSALSALNAGSFGNNTIISALKDHVAALDNDYFEAQKEFWAGKTSKETYLDLFAKARVANAVLSALDNDPFVAVTHSLYEVCAALGVEFVQSQVNRVPGFSN